MQEKVESRAFFYFANLYLGLSLKFRAAMATRAIYVEPADRLTAEPHTRQLVSSCMWNAKCNFLK